VQVPRDSCVEDDARLLIRCLPTLHRFNLFVQQKCGFRKAPRKVEPRRSDTGSSGEAYKRSALIPPLEETVFYPSPYPIRTLVKPFFFTIGVRAQATAIVACC
jgi:hypothetical protein